MRRGLPDRLRQPVLGAYGSVETGLFRATSSESNRIVMVRFGTVGAHFLGERSGREDMGRVADA